MTHTIYEERDLNSLRELFEEAAHLKPDPEMVTLATQLIKRQAGRYNPADLEDRYETRLRAMIDAKLKGEGVDPEAAEAPQTSNVIDLMAALKKSLGQVSGEEPKKIAPAAKRGKAKEPVRNQPGSSCQLKAARHRARRLMSRCRSRPSKQQSRPEYVRN